MLPDLTALRCCRCILATSRTRPAPSSMKDSAVGEEGCATTSGLPPAPQLPRREHTDFPARKSSSAQCL